MRISLLIKCATRSASIALLASIALVPSTTHAQPTPYTTSADSYLLTDKESIGVLPPQRIADDVLAMKWSVDSKRVIALSSQEKLPTKEEPPRGADVTITRWDRRSQTSSTIWKRHFENGIMFRSDLQWLPTTDVALQQIAWMETTPFTQPDGQVINQPKSHNELLWIDADHSVVKEIPTDDFTQVFISPTRPLVVLIHQVIVETPPPTVLIALRPDGTPGATLELPKGGQVTGRNWSVDGRLLQLLLVEVGPDKKPLSHWLAFNPTAGTTALLEKQPPVYSAPPAPPSVLYLKSTPQVVKDEDSSASILPLWMEASMKSERPRTLVSAHADQGILAPDGSAVAYRSLGSGWVSEFMRFPLAEFKAMQARARRITLISNAKQLGLSAFMWANDHDDTFPGPDNIEDELRPYLQTDSLFDGFTYTYDGGPMSDIQSPSETEIGYVNGPDGRAIIYADGSVKWRNR